MGLGCNTFIFESAKQKISSGIRGSITHSFFSKKPFAGVSWVCDTLIFSKKFFAGEGVRGRFAGLWHIHFFKEAFRGGFAGLWHIYFFKEIFRGLWFIPFSKWRKKKSRVCETFVVHSEKKKILAGASRGRGFAGEGYRGTVTHSFVQRNISPEGEGVAGWRAQASKVLRPFIEFTKRARLSARECKSMTKLMLKLENTCFLEKRVRLGARSHSKPLLHYTTINDRAHFSERM